jgi:hypothetical protein
MAALAPCGGTSNSAVTTEYSTPDDTITFTLPDGYYMITDDPYSADKAFVFDEGWGIKAAKDGSNGEKDSYSLGISAFNANTLIEGVSADNAFAAKVDQFKKDTTEEYTKTASGQPAWIGLSNEYQGRYSALIDLSDKNKIIQVSSIPQSDSTQPQAGMTADSFKAFIESINIE